MNVFFCPDGITPNFGLTGPNNTYVYIYIYIYTHTHTYVYVLMNVMDKECLQFFIHLFLFPYKAAYIKIKTLSSSSPSLNAFNHSLTIDKNKNQTCLLWSSDKLTYLTVSDFNYHIWQHIFLKYLLKFPWVLYAICRFKIQDSWPKLATWQLLLA